MTRYLVLLLAAGAMAYGAPVHAHHSFAATYMEDQSITIEGELVQILFRNPHSFVHVRAKDQDGNTVRWAVEWCGAGQLDGQGVTSDTLKAGDYVVISGAPGRTPGENRIRMATIMRPKDGFGWTYRSDAMMD